MTRRVIDPAVSDDYAQPVEDLGHGAQIVRLDCGPEGYLRKEDLWDHLDEFVDNLLDLIRRECTAPTLIHSHYADAGYVGLAAVAPARRAPRAHRPFPGPGQAAPPAGRRA